MNARVDSDYREAVNKEQLLGQRSCERKSRVREAEYPFRRIPAVEECAENDNRFTTIWKSAFRKLASTAGFLNNSIRIADFARPPDSPVFPRTKLNSCCWLLSASLVLAICTAILSDVMDNTIRDPEQVARAFDTSVLGTLPTVKEMRRLIHPGAAEFT